MKLSRYDDNGRWPSSEQVTAENWREIPVHEGSWRGAVAWWSGFCGAFSERSSNAASWWHDDWCRPETWRRSWRARAQQQVSWIQAANSTRRFAYRNFVAKAIRAAVTKLFTFKSLRYSRKFEYTTREVGCAAIKILWNNSSKCRIDKNGLDEEGWPGELKIRILLIYYNYFESSDHRTIGTSLRSRARRFGCWMSGQR